MPAETASAAPVAVVSATGGAPNASAPSESAPSESAPSESAPGESATGESDGIDIAGLRAAVLVLARRLRHQVAGDEISSTEGAVLGHLGHCGPMTPGQLARAEHVQPPSMTRVIELLERRGFVRREPHPTDGRQILVTRTEAGDAFVLASREVRSAWLRERIDQLDPAERKALAAATEALTRLAAMP